MLVLGAICAVLLALSAPALAASPAVDAYGGSAANQTVSTSSLPFTGINSTLVAVIGAGLLGTGFAVRRAVRSS